MISTFLASHSIYLSDSLRTNSGIFFLAITLIIINPLTARGHFQDDQVPCDIRLVFGVNEGENSMVSYDLEMQIQNQQRRTIRGVSVHWLDTQAEIIGNSSLTCEPNNQGIKPNEFGSCKHTVQKISERLLDRLGQETWTKIINSEMLNFREVRACRIIGYNYGKASVRNY